MVDLDHFFFPKHIKLQVFDTGFLKYIEVYMNYIYSVDGFWSKSNYSNL